MSLEIVSKHYEDNDLLQYSKAYKPQIIKHNRAQCLLCENVIESLHVHDFVWCACRTIFLDGGKDYLRRGSKKPAYFKDLTEYES